MKKISKFVQIFIIILIFASCSQKKENQSISPITFTFYTEDFDGSTTFDDRIAKEITKRTGVYLDITGPKSQPSDNVQLMILNNSFPDLIFAKSENSKLIENKALIPLDGFIRKYGDNIVNLYGDKILRLRNSLDDPSIYTVGSYEIKTNVLETSGNMQIQNAVLREFGYPRISTLDDVENLLLSYKEKYPQINGHKTIGLSLLTDSWHWLLSVSNPGNFMIGFPDDGQWIINQKTFEAQYKFLHPEMNIFYKWLNKLYHEDLLDPESFTQTEDMWKQKLSSGCVLATTYPLWGLKDIQNNLVDNDLTERTFAYLPITADKKYKDPSLKDYGFSGGWGIGITIDCKDPVRAFKFLDFMCSEEAQILTNWGIENVDYIYNENNERISINNNAYNEGVGVWLYPFPQGGSGFIDSTGNSLAKSNKENIINKYNFAEKETLKAYGVELWCDLFPSAKELGISKHGQIWQYLLSSQDTEILDAINEYVKQSIIKMIMEPQEKFDDSWEKMQSHIKEMGIETVSQNVTTLIKIKMKLWNYSPNTLFRTLS